MRFYHISTDPHISETVIYPRVPAFRMQTEDPMMDRICVSASILGCLSASRFLQKGQHVFVYTCESEKYVQPTIEQVADVAYTGEVWLTEATKIDYYQEIRILEVHKTTIEQFEIPFYEYEVIDQ